MVRSGLAEDGRGCGMRRTDRPSGERWARARHCRDGRARTHSSWILKKHLEDLLMDHEERLSGHPWVPLPSSFVGNGKRPPFFQVDAALRTPSI